MSLNLVTLLYLVASVFFIQALKGLSHPTTSRRGNAFGMVGMAIAIVTTVALIDTDCDPDEVDLPIPGNDDSIRSIELIIRLLADAVLAGKADAGALKQEQAEGAAV